MITIQQWNHATFNDDIIAESLDDILSDTSLLALATVAISDDRCIPLNATCAFAFSPECHIYILTPPASDHGLALRRAPDVALAVYDSHQDPAKLKRGLQISGMCVPARHEELEHAKKEYHKRFMWMEEFVRWHSEWRPESEEAWLYKITPKKIKIFDEERFGNERLATVTMPEEKVVL